MFKGGGSVEQNVLLLVPVETVLLTMCYNNILEDMYNVTTSMAWLTCLVLEITELPFITVLGVTQSVGGSFKEVSRWVSLCNHSLRLLTERLCLLPTPGLLLGHPK